MHNERQWHFVPRAPWRWQSYQLAVDARLEDLAGNNVHEVFDHTIGSRHAADARAKYLLPFHPIH